MWLIRLATGGLLTNRCDVLFYRMKEVTKSVAVWMKIVEDINPIMLMYLILTKVQYAMSMFSRMQLQISYQNHIA